MTRMTLTFDTLAYANKLKAVGFSEKQAEVQAEAIAELVANRLLPTKQNLKELEPPLSQEFDLQLKEFELRMLIKLGVIMVSSVGLLIVLLKLFHL